METKHMDAKPLKSAKHTIPAVCTAMDLLRLLSEEPSDTTTKALAWRLGVPRTTCYRILRSLILKDWVRTVEGGRHELSLGLLPLLNPLQHVEQLAHTVQPALDALAMRTQLTAKVTVRQGDYAVTVARCESPQQTSVAVRLGASFHLAIGSSGTCLLSDLDADEVDQILDRAPEECWVSQDPDDVHRRLRELRHAGWCADIGLYSQSCHAVSAPLRDAQGEVMAAMTVIGFPHELPRERLAAPVKMLTEAARRAEKELRKLISERDRQRPAPLKSGKEGHVK